MAEPFKVDVVSPEATVWSGEATIVVARTPEGEIGILADHEPLMGALATGPVAIETTDGERLTIGVHGGFIQVLDNQVTLLTDRAELVSGGRDDATEVAQRLAEAEGEAEEATDAVEEEAEEEAE